MKKNNQIKKTVINVLSLIVVCCLVSSVFLTMKDKQIPDFINAIGISTSGALIAVVNNNDNKNNPNLK